jgi:UDP-glucose:O-linked fucose beta-1,3-glucosyltransferase
MKYFFILLLLFSIYFSFSTTNKVTNEFIILIISQPHIYILSQVHNASIFIPKHIPLLYTHSYASSVSNWYAIYPTFSSIINQYPQLKWLFICEPQTRFNLTEMIKFAEQSKDLYIGHGLYDTEPSIIHHYSFSFDNPYPDFASGVLISRIVLSLFLERLKSYKKQIDFIIDIKYEFNQLINELTDIKLIDRSDLFCNQYKNHCLTWYDGQDDYLCPRTDIQLNDLYIGIKTFINYHQNRIEFLKKTWLNNKLNYNLFTNDINETIDNKNERFIINKENTERGHCHKTFTILNYFYKNKENFKYLILVDDDTLLSIQRLLRLIRCFMLSNDIPLVLGERYGYGNYYDYPTGGSGIIFNRQAVQQIISNCQCPSPDTPDDMFLGLCLNRIHIPLIHIPELHQAQPNAYSKDWLQHQKPISFHKFEDINVEEVYQTYLHEEPPIEINYHQKKDEF